MTEPGTPQPVTPAAPDLTFDRVEPTLNVPHDPAATETAGILCASCGAVMLDEYYSVGDKPICASCSTTFEKTRATSRTSKAFGKALVFGLGAALAGAVVYYAVIALLDLEIGIVAILIGWMVGRAILKALPGGGSRRYQVMAALLTYFAVGVAYLPLAFNSTTPGLGALAAFAFALPVMMAFSSGGGILSALIIAIGMHQAWRMTGASGLAVTGPFRVGNEPVTPGVT